MKANKKKSKGIYTVSNPIKSCNKCINIIINYFLLVSGGILLPTILWFNLSLSWKTLSKLIFPAEQRTTEKIVWEKTYICHKTRNSWIMKSQTWRPDLFTHVPSSLNFYLLRFYQKPSLADQPAWLSCLNYKELGAVWCTIYLPNSDLMVVCASWVTANSGSSTP